MNAEEIQVLHVDDEPSLTNLTSTFLERESDRFTVETATSANEGLQRISDHPPDCVVSDYNMPGMDGIDFLQTVREQYPDLPFIVFTGKGSEAVASEAIAADATDYLQKGSGSEKYELLANRIRNAVQARREAQRAERQEQLMRLTELTGDTGGFELDTESNTVVLTAGTRRIIGRRNQHEMPLEEALKLFHPDDREDIQHTLDRAFGAGEELHDRWRLQPDDGDERLLDITITPVVENGEVTKLRGAGHDITDRTERQRKLTQIETLFQHAQDSLFLIDAGEEFTVERVNPAWEDAMGISAEQIQDNTPRDVLGEQQGAVSEDKFRECVQRQEPLQYEETARLNGKLTYWETRIAPVVIGGTVEYIAGATRDITEQKERERELGAVSSQYQTLVENLPDGAVFLFDTELEYVRAGGQELSAVGLSPEEVRGKGPRDLFPEEIIDDTVQYYQETLDGTSHTYEEEYRGEQYRIQTTPVRTDDGEIAYGLSVLQNVTEEAERERALQRIKQAVESAGHAIVITDTDGTIEYVNPAFEELTGFTQTEVVGKNPRVLNSGKMSDEYFDELWETICSGDVWEEEITNQRKNGETYTAMQTIAPVTDGDDIHAFVAIQEDITERKEREETLARRTEAIADAPVGISISDPDQADNPLIYVNDRFVEMTGYRREEVLGRNFRFLQGENTDPDTVARIREAIDAEELVSVELRNYRKDGTEFWNHIEIAPVRDDAGEVVNYIGFQQDLTERKQRQEQLGILDRVLRHNLRNDMNVIRGRAETIQSEASDEVAAAAGAIVEKSDELLGLAEKERQITELLRDEPTKKEIKVCEQLQQITSRVESEHPEATITVECSEEVTVRATTEFGETVRELVTNAIVHNDSSSPEVTLSVTQSDETVRIDIADTGPRIPEMERNVLMSETEQTPLYHGSGLGLWLVNLVITRSNGTIRFAENTPAGNIVSIYLPQ